MLRLSAAYALADMSDVIDEPHMRAALAIWAYIESTAEWMFGDHVDPKAMDGLIGYITAAGRSGRTRTQITADHYGGHKRAPEITAVLGELIGVRQEVDSSRPGRPATRYFAC